jgi:transcriptional regulator with XRE-family HTH domain
MTITPALVRAARALLGWSQKELGRRSNVSKSVIAAFETRKRLPGRGGVDDLRRTLEGAGIEFVDGEPGVRLRKAPT